MLKVIYTYKRKVSGVVVRVRGLPKAYMAAT